MAGNNNDIPPRVIPGDDSSAIDDALLEFDDGSEVADQLIDAIDDGDLVGVLKTVASPEGAFDFIAYTLYEDWQYGVSSKEEKDTLSAKLIDVVEWYSLDPSSAALVWYWQMIVAWMKGDYEQFLSLKNSRETVPSILFHRYFPDEITSYTIRSLLRLGRFEDALEAARHLPASNHVDWYVMTVYAVAGQSDSAIPLLNKCLEQFSVYDGWIRGNPDLWNAIQGEEYSDWLAKAIAKEGMTYDEWRQKQDEDDSDWYEDED